MPEPLPQQRAYMRPGFDWAAASAYLFDIDGTLLNSRDAVHYFAFRNAMREVLGIEASIEGVHVHGNTDPGILRAVLRREGMDDAAINVALPEIMERMCAEVGSNREQLNPELCPAIPELLEHLRSRSKALGVVSGNLEPIGWLKLEKAGLKPLFSFASFSHPREYRVDIFRHGMEQARKKMIGSNGPVFFVGDTPSDIQAARKVGTAVIALATGIYKFSELLACEPDACFACATDLLEKAQRL
ncbi:MAG TPA: HAD family hydrolase [Candidatus Angelobacter sp.]|nr:HAD family hydrolase [Candidatus Angelobacter sp.]